MALAVAEMDNPTISGSQHRATHKAAVIAILGKDARPVSSRGSRFYNRDKWTARLIVKDMCQWASENPDCTPTKAVVKQWVESANAVTEPHPEIVIANTPDRLRVRVAMALIGGAYHEAFHTKYSCRRSLKEKEVCKIVLPRWAKVPNWAAVGRLILDWSNIIEDIRIERRGREDFPGVETKLHDLQDFVLRQEAAGVEEVRSHGGSGKRGALSIIAGVFRDVGLGYSTQFQHEMMAKYRQDNPDAVAFVLEGPLRPILDEAIALSHEDDLGSLRLAMDAVVHLVERSQTQKAQDEAREEAKDGQAGDGATKCPSCGAPAHKLIVRPMSDGKGGKVRNKGICTCTVCGYQDEVDIKGSKESKNRDKNQPNTPGPQFVGFEDKDFAEFDEHSPGNGPGQPPKDHKDQKATPEGKGSDGKDEGAGDGDTDDTEANAAPNEAEDAGDQDGEDTEGQGDGAEEDADAEQGSGEEGAGTDDADASDLEFMGQDYAANDGTQSPEAGDVSDQWADGPEGSPKDHSAGRGAGDTSPQVSGNDWKGVAEEVVQQVEAGESTGLLDNNSALQSAVAEDQSKEDGKSHGNEQAYRPYDPSLDDVVLVPPSRKGLDYDKEQAAFLLHSVKMECAFLRARMAQIFRAMEMTDVVHGLRRGAALSTQYMVDTALTIRSGFEPDRAYMAKDEQLDLSMSAAIVIDESGSMAGILGDCTRILIALVEPLDRLGIPVQASGFRDGRHTHRGRVPTQEDEMPDVAFHRYGGITHDVFKRFDEKFSKVSWRFANTRATGGTPMADGIQFGLMALNYRTEGHRVLFIITDGQPTEGHDVIPWQIRKAKDAGIHIVGVGLGAGAHFVKDLFPDHVWSNSLAEMPRLLIAKLNQIIDTKAIKRGGRMAIGIKAATTR